MRTRLTCSLLFVAILVGCRQQTASEPSDDVVEQYGLLPKLAQTHFQPLRDELDRLIDERATPELLAIDGSTARILGSDGQSRVLAHENNAALVLVTIFPAETLSAIDTELDRRYPGGPFRFDPTALALAGRFRKQYEAELDRFRAAMKCPGCNFMVPFTRGLMIDLSLADAARVGNRLEGLAAAEQLADGKPDAAVESIRYMLRMARFLAAANHVVYRSEAARLREEALRVAEEVVQHPNASRASVAAVYDVLDGQLADWPDDARVWIGDRAIGMHTFELVRDGHLLSVLSDEEIAQFEQAGTLGATVDAIARSIDQDEMFYLKAMRSIIEACEKPYFARAATFTRIRRELDESSTTAQYPTLTATVLWPSVEPQHTVQARDRALCEAWALALAAALQRPAPAVTANPLTGKPYEVKVEPHRVVVSGIDFPQDDFEIVVPRQPPQPREEDPVAAPRTRADNE